MNKHKSTLARRWAIPVSLFVLALMVRIPTLGQFITFDESRWINRSRWFVSGLFFAHQECPPVQWGREFATQGLGCTLQIGYPGVTTMWAGSLGLLLHYWQTTSLTGVDWHTFLQTLPIYALDPAIIAPTRLPLVIVGALFVPFFYGLLRRLFTKPVAIIAALLVAWHPFHIALSRVLHHDALVATFMVLSLLALAGYWLRGWRWYWLIGSAVLGGLALLSKQTSWFMPPYVAVLAGWTLYYRWQQRPHGTANIFAWPTLWRLGAEGVLWGVIAGLTFAAFFPAMWIMPGEVIRVIFGASTALAQEGHTHYFWGEVSTDPGPFFCLVGWLLRATPLEILGLLSVLIAAGWSLARQRLLSLRLLKQQAIAHPVEVALLLFVALFWLFVAVSNKKMVRYFLPAFPVIDVFVALGLLWWLDRRWFNPGPVRYRGVLLLSSIILLVQGWLVVSHYPYYLTYHNPLFGGVPGAARLMTILGWGEGLNEAAAYLNEQPEAESLQVVTERFCSMLQPFFVGKVSCLNSSLGGIMRADYMVYYYNLVQRQLAWPEQWHYFARHHAPVHRVTLHGLDYVLIYRNPIQHQVDRKANHLAGVLTAFGYNLSDGQLTLFWQNLRPGQRQLLVGLAPTSGVYPVGAPAVSGERQWVACSPAPAFASEMDTPKAIIESLCPLASIDLPAGLYDLQLALGDDSAITPIESSLLAVVLIDAEGHFEHVQLRVFQD